MYVYPDLIQLYIWHETKDIGVHFTSWKVIAALKLLYKVLALDCYCVIELNYVQFTSVKAHITTSARLWIRPCMSVHVCVRVRVRVRARVRLRIRLRDRVRLSVRLCVLLCVCAWVRVYIRVCACVFMLVYVRVYMCVYACVIVYVWVYACMFLCACMLVCSCLRTCVCVRVRVRDQFCTLTRQTSDWWHEYRSTSSKFDAKTTLHSILQSLHTTIINSVLRQLTETQNRHKIRCVFLQLFLQINIVNYLTCVFINIDSLSLYQ